MSKLKSVTVEMALDRGLLAETSLHILALMAGVSQKEFARITGPLVPHEVRTELLKDLFIKCELCDPAGVTKMAVAVLETVRSTGWPLVNIEHLAKSFIHNPYLVRNEVKKGFGFSIEKHNIVKVYCRIFDESLPRT